MTPAQYIKTGSDESYTYPNLVKVIKPFIDKFAASRGGNITIWCPFDKEWSNYVKLFKEWGYNVIHSHIDDGKDFFTYQPEESWDIIVSNPPFKNKALFFTRALSFNKPFALVAPVTWLNDGTPNKLFMDSGVELIIPNRRAKFFNTEGNVIGNRPSFKSVYFCKWLCTKEINFVDMEKE